MPLTMDSRLRYRATPTAAKGSSSSTTSMSRASPLLSSAKAAKRFAAVLTGLLAMSLLATLFAGVSLHRYISAGAAGYHFHPDSGDDNTEAVAYHPNKLLKDLEQFQQPPRQSQPKKENVQGSSPSTNNNNTNSVSTVSNYLRHPTLQLSLQSSNRQYLQLSPATKDTSNNDHRPWSWPIIHTVSTRFMQNQGSLQNLARSRLKLLEAVCLPSLQHQSIFYQDKLLELYQNTKWKEEVSSMVQQQARVDSSPSIVVDPLFLWIIKVDPNIDKQILKELNDILEPVKHFTLVIGSNNNFGVGVKNGGWRDGQAGQDILDAFEDKRVFFPEQPVSKHDESLGSSMHQIIRRAHEAREDRVVLETRLDADDAINVEYINQLQRVALKSLIDTKDSKFIRKSDDDDDDATPEQEIQQARWIYYCARKHMEWNPSSPFYNPNNDAGLLTLFGKVNFCITPGLTIGYAVGTEEENVPHYEHTKVYPESLIDTKDSKFIRKSDDDDDDATPEQEIQQARWIYYCARKHMEWNPSSPFYNPNNDAGLLTLFGKVNFCITPGLTIGYAVGTEEENVPHYEHTKVYPELLLKSDYQRKKDGDVGCGFNQTSDCLWMVDYPEISAFRSRSMTSAGMFNIEAAGVPTGRSRATGYSKELWKGKIEKWFGITSSKAKEAADFMASNYINTVRDNMRGQCTHGHSCKISSVEKLQRTIDLSEESSGSIEVGN